MRRREFIAALGGGAAWPVMTRAQQARKLPTIGFLGAATESAWREWADAFLQRMRELGWVEGRTIAIEFRWADGRSDRYNEIATEFVRLKVDVIVTSGGAVLAAKRVTSTTPIVFGVANNPVESGLVASLARPGGNVTGLSAQQPEIVGKRLDLLREVVPRLKQLAVLANVGYPASALEMREAEAAARALGLEVKLVEVRMAADIASGIDSINGQAQAMYLCSDPLLAAQLSRINTLALVARLPTIGGIGRAIETGSLVAYGAHIPDLWRRAGEIVDKILRGAKPADIPVEQPTKFHLGFNLVVAKALGFVVPTTLLARADEVIE
jgi:putative tryptophan/tyrosine transport system substrate-binding protein